ncbi:protein unc-79 homolog, partial [Copidosoma floridanum]|uniref:protein unc-79 homolog n=1 Tax=Copidosoma floridanum TaxID=29053 RepID=UPI000C6F5FCF
MNVAKPSHNYNRDVDKDVAVNVYCEVFNNINVCEDIVIWVRGTQKLFLKYAFSGILYTWQAENSLEKLKTDFICPWLSQIMIEHNDLLISCLLPYPLDYVRIGGYWETLTSRTLQLKDGLNRLFCLIPYEVVTFDNWNSVMPYWMDAITNDVPQHELLEIKLTLCKMFDSEMSPLGLDVYKMYDFISKRFNEVNLKVQEQALRWLQTLTVLEINVPLHFLFSIFNNGIKNITQYSITEKESTEKNNEEHQSSSTNDASNYKSVIVKFKVKILMLVLLWLFLP